MTYKHPWYTAQQRQENTSNSDVVLTLKRPLETPGRTHTDSPSFKGDLCEHIVIVEAMKRGAYVYKNVGCSGKTDMIIQKNDLTLHIDVKANTTHKSPGIGISLVHVDLDSGSVYWGRPNTIPTLWSDFWS